MYLNFIMSLLYLLWNFFKIGTKNYNIHIILDILKLIHLVLSLSILPAFCNKYFNNIYYSIQQIDHFL